MHKFMFLKAIKITMSQTNAETPLKNYFFESKQKHGKKAHTHTMNIEVNGKDCE